MNPANERMMLALLAVAIVIVTGGVAFYSLGAGQWSMGDSLYMSAISASTAGFTELPRMELVPGARLTTVVVILLGIGAFAFFQSSLTAFFVEGALGEAFRRRRMERAIAELKGHIVVVGCGSTGRHVVQELVSTETPFVVIDKDAANLADLNEEFGGKLLYIVGEATHDATLVHAGMERAKGLIAALTHDRDNLYVVLSGRGLNPQARIIAKVVEPEALPKMLRAGANTTVSPNTIGGMRMASEMIRPSVVQFLDLMLRDKERNLRIEEAPIPAGSSLVGKALKDAEIQRESNTLVLAMRVADGKMSYNPSPETVIREGSVLVVMGEVKDIQRLRGYVQNGA